MASAAASTLKRSTDVESANFARPGPNQPGEAIARDRLLEPARGVPAADQALAPFGVDGFPYPCSRAAREHAERVPAELDHARSTNSARSAPSALVSSHCWRADRVIGVTMRLPLWRRPRADGGRRRISRRRAAIGPADHWLRPQGHARGRVHPDGR
jgi:hypothetical protein